MSCASIMLEGYVVRKDAMGFNDDLGELGLALLYASYPHSDLQVISNDQIEDNFYNVKFGKYQ